MAGIEYAPLKIPLHRRLETAAIAYYVNQFLFLGFFCLFFFIYLLLCTNYYWIPLLYAVYYYFDRDVCNQGGRLNPWVRRWFIWPHLANYFPLKLIKTCDLDPSKNYIFGYHPHGIMCFGAFGNFATEGTHFSEKFPGIYPHILALEGQFKFPIHRDLFLATGACACTKPSIEYFLSGKDGTGHACVIMIGGAVEALDAIPGTMRLTIQPRKGFVKLAIKHGASLVPVLSFGENDVFDQKPADENSLMYRLQRRLTKMLGFSPPIFHGRGVFNYSMGYIPYRKPIYTVVGSPIETERIENPTEEDVSQVHQKYIKGLQTLFDEYKDQYGSPALELQIK